MKDKMARLRQEMADPNIIILLEELEDLAHKVRIVEVHWSYLSRNNNNCYLCMVLVEISDRFTYSVNCTVYTVMCKLYSVYCNV